MRGVVFFSDLSIYFLFDRTIKATRGRLCETSHVGIGHLRGRLCETSHVGIGHLGTLVYHSFRFRGIRLFNAMPKQIRDLSCSVSSFKYQLDKYLSTIPDTPCIANYDNSLENSSHTNPHLLTGVHPV